MWKMALKWLGIVALGLGMVYAIYDTGYNSGYAMATSELQSQSIQLQTEKLEITDKIRIEQKRRTKDVTSATTQYHESVSGNQSEAETIRSALLSNGLRNDLARRSCVRITDSTSRDSSAGECGLLERDVRDLIGLAEEAERVKDKLTACQGVINAWISSQE